MFEEAAYQAHPTGGETLEQALSSQGGPFLVTFSADWCPPCHALKPVLDRIARELGQRLKVLVVDADQNPSLVEKFGVEGIPTTLLLAGGKVLDRIVGVQPFDSFRKRLEKVLR